MLSAIMQKCYDYYDGIPADTVTKILKSAVYTFTVTLLFSPAQPKTQHWNIGRPLMAAGVAALASLIYALTVPIFNYMFGDDRILFHREAIKNLINTAITSTFVNYLTTGKVDLLSCQLFGSFSWNVVPGILESMGDYFNLFDSGFANDWRAGCRYFGLDATPGSSSIFINFGLWP